MVLIDRVEKFLIVADSNVGSCKTFNEPDSALFLPIRLLCGSERNSSENPAAVVEPIK